MKKVLMIKSVFDDPNAPTWNDAINPLCLQLTERFFAPVHPFGTMIRKKVFEEELKKRIICFELYQCTPTDRDIQVHALTLGVKMRDYPTLGPTADDMQTMYINGELGQFLNTQGFNVPCQNSREVICFLCYLHKYVPNIWDYFKVLDN